MTNDYQHSDTYRKAFKTQDMGTLPVGKVVCVGRNYMDHIHELGNEQSALPVLFMKPSTAIVDMQQPISLPRGLGECHNEIELAFLIGQKLTNADRQLCSKAIVGVGLALDLTLRDLQTELKNAGQPWERAKAFDGSCPVSGFVPIVGFDDQIFEFSLQVNGKYRQQGNSSLMLNKVLPLLEHISKTFTLMPGDIVITGTPKGVAALNHGDVIDAELAGYFSVRTHVLGER